MILRKKIIFSLFYFLKKFSKIVLILVFLVIFSGLIDLVGLLVFKDIKTQNTLIPKQAKAIYQYTPTEGQLVVGSNLATSLTNVGSWKGILANDGRYWQVARSNPGGLDIQFWFDGVNLYGANKIIITIEDSNVTTGEAYIHQICDWVSSDGVDNSPSGNCTGGGWRTLHPRKLNYANTGDTTRIYEIYNGYFDRRNTPPGNPINTPLTNFIEPTNKRILLRTYSTVNSNTQYRIDVAMVEVAIDPIYEPAEVVIESGGTPTNFYSDLIGTVTTGVNASDNVKLIIPMPAVNQPVDVTFKFKNIKTYPSMNTILVLPELCVSNTALTFNIYLRNFSSNTWTPLLATNQTGTACGTDTDYAFAFNMATISNFNFSNYISWNGEIWVRFLTNAPSTVYNIQFDRIYMMLGSVNTDQNQCEISWGTGVASNCANTRDVREAKTGLPTTNTWQITSVLEYPPAGWYALDNDNDGTNGEAAFAGNISFPVTLATNTAVTAYHYAVKYRSNNTSLTIDLQVRNYSGNVAHNNALAGAGGWENTPGTDSNASTAYSWYDTWILSEGQVNPDDYVDTVNNRMNLRVRTAASALTTAGTVMDWDFAMVSIRWIDATPPPTISCTFSANSTSFSNLSPTAVSTSTPDITITITSSGGFQITVRDSGNGTNPGLYKSTTPTYLISSADATLTAGSDGYGIQATTTASNITINPKYNQSGNNVGGLSLTDIQLASSTSAVSNAQINIKHKASASYLAPVGSYSDTITYTCSAL